METNNNLDIFIRDDLDAGERKELKALGYLKSGLCFYHPMHWAPCKGNEVPDTWYYEDSFRALTPEAKQEAENQ